MLYCGNSVGCVDPGCLRVPPGDLVSGAIRSRGFGRHLIFQDRRIPYAPKPPAFSDPLLASASSSVVPRANTFVVNPQLPAAIPGGIVSIGNRLKKIALIGGLGLTLLCGAPMSPKDIEELLRQVQMPKVAHTLREENDNDDGSRKRLRV
jgi:hypothetical protein